MDTSGVTRTAVSGDRNSSFSPSPRHAVLYLSTDTPLYNKYLIDIKSMQPYEF